MTPANPPPRRLKVIDSTMRLDDPTAMLAVVEMDSDTKADRADDDLVSLRNTELRTTLASIVCFAELIDSGDLTDNQRHLYAGVLLRDVRWMAALIHNAMALQQLESGHRELDFAPVDVRSLIQRAVLAAGEDDQRPIDVLVPAQLPLVWAEAEAILEVLTNFLSNARRFSPDGGEIRIAARPVGDMVEVHIRDHGIGIEAEALPKLFHKYYRAPGGVPRLARGAGLGLAINLRIIEAHGGQVEASSKGLGKGAHFQFSLQIARPGAESVDVLIVEGDSGFASLMKAEFGALGLSTVRAADAETAERMLEDMTPRAIILELALPGLQGEDLLGRMWTGGGKRLPVVVLTVKNLGPVEIAALEMNGATAVLPKEAGAPQAAVALIVGALALDAVAG